MVTNTLLRYFNVCRKCTAKKSLDNNFELTPNFVRFKFVLTFVPETEKRLSLYLLTSKT